MEAGLLTHPKKKKKKKHGWYTKAVNIMKRN